MEFTRRQFIKTGLVASAATALPPIWWRAREAKALEACEQGVNLVLIQLEGGNDGINTVIPMTNGTGANRTAYEFVRPTIGIDVGNPSLPELTPTQIGYDPLHTNAQLALHPHMSGLKALYDSGNLAVVLGTHYPNESLSHDVSETIWYRADPSRTGPGTGWMGHTLDNLCLGQPSAVPAVDTQGELTPLFYGQTSVMAFDRLSDLVFPVNSSFDSLQVADYKNRFSQIYNTAAASGATFVRALGTAGSAAAAKVDAYALADESLAVNLNDLINGTNNSSSGSFGVVGRSQSYSLARGLRTIFALMSGGPPGTSLGCRIFRAHIGGFDNHSGQGIHVPLSTKSIEDKVLENFSGERHGRLLHRVDRAISAFWQDCVDANLHRNTIVMTFSEFGRRVEENGPGSTDSGTDHGTAASMFVIGPKAGESSEPVSLVGGMHGAYAELDAPNLNDDGNLVFTVDFRQVYGEIINSWLGLSLATTQSILGGFGYAPQGLLT